MGEKYIKKDEDGKEYLYEDMGFAKILFGDRKIGEVKESGPFKGSDAEVKSDDLFSSESYSINRTKNPIGGQWGIPDYSKTEVTDDRSAETSSYDYEWRIDGGRYSEQPKEPGDAVESSNETQTMGYSYGGGYSGGLSSSSARSRGIIGRLATVIVIGMIAATAFSMFGERSSSTSRALQAQPTAPIPTQPSPRPQIQILNVLTAAGADPRGNPVGITDAFYGNYTYYRGVPADDRYSGPVMVFVDYVGDLPFVVQGEIHLRLMTERGSLGIGRCQPKLVDSPVKRFYCEGNTWGYALLPGQYEIQMRMESGSWVRLTSFSVRPRTEIPAMTPFQPAAHSSGIPTTAGFQELLDRYARKPERRALAIAADIDGRWAFGDSQNFASQAEANDAAMAYCIKYRNQLGLHEPCQLYAIGNEVIWQASRR